MVACTLHEENEITNNGTNDFSPTHRGEHIVRHFTHGNLPKGLYLRDETHKGLISDLYI